jgi:predicted Zn finger-like uncharacterized protein
MIIKCPFCGRKYRLEDGLAKARFQRMRCSLCGHVFVHEYSPVLEDDTDPATLASDAEQREIPVRKKRRVSLPAFVVAITLLFIAVTSAYIYWVNHIGAADKWLSIRNMEGQETVIQDRKIFLVKGRIVNGSTKPRKYVILKAKLFDEHGRVIGEHFGFAGPPLPIDEVRGMGSSEIEKKVADFRLPNLSAFLLRKGGELPFSILFPDTGTGTPKGFTVEVIDSPFL